MNTPPIISEDDLHAWVDETLTPERHLHVAHYLQTHPQAARRVHAWQAQRTQLRTALAPVFDEALPPELNLRRMVAARQAEHRAVRGWFLLHWFSSWRFSFWASPRRAIAATAVLALCLGGIGGWALRAMDDSGPTASLLTLGHDAAASYKVYAPDRLHPVEIRAENHPLLAAWAAAHTGKPLTIPALQAAGYRFMGGRVLATTHGAAVLLMYDDDRGAPDSRLVMLARPMKSPSSSPSGSAADPRMQPVSWDDIHGFVWADGGLGYSLVGSLALAALHPLADEVRRQIGKQGL